MKIIILLCLIVPVIAFAKQKRTLANKTSKEVYTFACYPEDSLEPVVIAALAGTIDNDDSNASTGSASVFVKQNKDFQTLILKGAVSKVPDGIVFVGQEGKNTTKYTFNIHPHDTTKINGQAPLRCEVTGQLKSGQ